METKLFQQWCHQLPAVERVYIHHSFAIPEVIGDLWWPGPFVQFYRKAEKWYREVDVIQAEDIDNCDNEEYDTEEEGMEYDSEEEEDED